MCDTCGISLPGESDGHLLRCDDCMQIARPWDKGRAALIYRGQARKIVLGLKHGDRTEMAPTAAIWMARVAQELVEPGMIVVPVPIHWVRLLKRRYNQSDLLGRPIARKLELSYSPDILVRRRNTQPMEGKTIEERRLMVANSIFASPRQKHRLSGRSVLLVDDVMTSGATLAACTKACLDNGANRVCVLVLARVQKDD